MLYQCTKILSWMVAIQLVLTNFTLAQTSNESFHWAWPKSEVAQAGVGFWPQFLGPRGDSHAAASSNPPTQWSDTQNVKWKTEIHGQGWSSPVIWGNRIWLTTATLDGKVMSVLCIDRNNGKILWDRVVFQNEKVQPDHHVTNSYASPTPVVDSKNVYVHFGAYGTASLDHYTGDIVWQRRDLPCNHFRGPGSSPVLYENLLIFAMDGYDFKYMVALNKQSGETVWKKDRNIEYGTDDGDVHKAYSTPTFARIGSRDIMVCSSSKAAQAFLPSTGEEVWRVRYGEYSTTGRAMFDGQRFFINTGFGKAKLLAVRPDGKGDVTDSHVDWIIPRGIGNKPSQTILGHLIFSVDDRGILTCFDKKDGSQLWQERVGGDFSATPLVAAGKVYLFDHEGASYVFDATSESHQIAQNKLPTGCRASPAALGNDLIVRTTNYLYCLSNSNATNSDATVP